MENEINILVIDDDPGILKTVSRHLQRMGYQVATAQSGNQALEIMDTAIFDVVLLDQTMPGMSGLETLETMAERLDEVPPVIMVTATDTRHLAVEFMKRPGAMEFTPKPVRFDLLEVQIGTVLRTHALEKECARAKAERLAAEEASRLKDQFLAAMGHEFRTPLGHIQGFAQLLEQKVPEDHGNRESISAILKAARDLTLLVDKLLEVTAEVQAHCHSISLDLEGMVRPLMDRWYETAAERKLALEVSLAGDLPMVNADPDLLGKIVNCLMDNAVKFTPEGGQIHVSTGFRNGRGVVSVGNTGGGIAPEHQEIIFDRFVRLDHSGYHPGAGLGLYLARCWAEKMESQLRVESRKGKGPVFHLSLSPWKEGKRECGASQ